MMDTALLWVGIGLAGVCGVMGVYWIAIRLMLSEAPGATEQFKVPTADGWTIRVCRYRNIERSGPPVIICHGIMANQFSFVAPKGDSLVDVLVERGFDCWVMDARGTRSSTAPPQGSRYDAKASDYALHDMPALIDFVRAHTGYSKVHWIGHSMGGMMLYMYLAAFGSDAIGSGTTLGSPPGLDHFKPQPLGGVLFFAHFVPVVVEFFWRCGSVLFGVFKINSKLVPINWDNMDPRVGAATFFNMVEFLPYPALHELGGWVREKRWVIQDGTIDVGANLPNMDAPLLLVYGSKDWFTPLDRGEALYKELRSRSKRLLVLGRETNCLHDYGHVDLVFSPRGRTELYEPIAAWMEAHSIPKGKPKSSHTMPRAHVPEQVHVDKHAAAHSDLGEPSGRSKAAPRAHRPARRTRTKTARRRSAGTQSRRKNSSKTRPKKSSRSGDKNVYATQKKVARKKKAAKKAAKAKKTSKAKPTRKKSAGGTKAKRRKSAPKKKAAVKKKAARTRAGAKKKPAVRKRSVAKKKAKKKPARRKRG